MRMICKSIHMQTRIVHKRAYSVTQNGTCNHHSIDLCTCMRTILIRDSDNECYESERVNNGHSFTAQWIWSCSWNELREQAMYLFASVEDRVPNPCQTMTTHYIYFYWPEADSVCMRKKASFRRIIRSFTEQMNWCDYQQVHSIAVGERKHSFMRQLLCRIRTKRNEKKSRHVNVIYVHNLLLANVS